MENITLFSRNNLSHICIDCKNIKNREKYKNNDYVMNYKKKSLKINYEVYNKLINLF